LTLATASALAQPTIFWTQYLGADLHDVGNCVRQTEDGGFIVTGSSEPLGAGYGDLLLVRTDENGVELWSRTYGGDESDRGYWVEETADGGFIVTGVTNEGMYDLYGDLWVLRTDANGDTLWSRVYDWGQIDRGYGVYETGEGDFIVAGIHDGGFTTYIGDVLVMKLDADGNTIWMNTIHRHGRDCGYSLAPTSDGGFIVSGATAEDPYAPCGDIYLLKFNTDGDTLWTRSYGDGLGLSVRQTSDGGYIVGGWTSSWAPGGESAYLLKTDADGIPLWLDAWGGGSPDYGRSVVEMADGGYALAGISYNGLVSAYGIYLVRTDADGNTVGTWNWGSEWYDQAKGITLTDDGNLLLTGLSIPPGGGPADALLMELEDNLGSVVVKLTPHGQPILIPPGGGSFTYDAELVNNSDTPYTVDVAFYVTQFWYEMGFPVAARNNISIAPDETITREDLMQYVAANPAADNYYYSAFIRDHYTQELYSTDCFIFEKLPGGDGTALSSSWELIGWDQSENAAPLPEKVELSAIHPNPFNPVTTISYTLPEASEVKMSVYDISGRQVAELVNGWRDAGVHNATFDASGLSSGVYLARLKAGDFSTAQKMALVK
jgi:hypothetical protein